MENIKSRYEELYKMKFDSYDSYMEWVRAWKEYYKELSEYIRHLRGVIQKELREYSWRYDEYFAHKVWPPWKADHIALWKLEAWRTEAKLYATVALGLRQEAKEKSWEQKQALDKSVKVV